ncbi:hypothetical protein [Roseicella aquatilis]|uniref:Uncharacterized protein n=1 Tax=Roseicella aquatilis TaxID=2527868 RepID=A0A4R4D487_9PROT|nr:hypothetical protein [Roseicella aquatilis]TCZ54597.1 hypothetical protein EXY23_23275 [Roseicella aquatilis]
MAFFPIDQTARERLAALPGVTIFPRPSPRRPEHLALVMAGLRCCEVVAAAGGYRAAYHLRFGTWLPLAEDGDEAAAFAAVLAFLALVAAVPQHYASEHDAAERRAAAQVLAAFSGRSAAIRLPAAA